VWLSAVSCFGFVAFLVGDNIVEPEGLVLWQREGRLAWSHLMFSRQTDWNELIVRSSAHGEVEIVGILREDNRMLVGERVCMGDVDYYVWTLFADVGSKIVLKRFVMTAAFAWTPGEWMYDEFFRWVGE
jgi:hypothetical protein